LAYLASLVVSRLSLLDPALVNVGAAAREVDAVGVSTARDVAVMMAFFFGQLDGEEQATGDPSVHGASAMAAPRSYSGVRSRG
jgi:hypothetical protein